MEMQLEICQRERLVVCECTDGCSGKTCACALYEKDAHRYDKNGNIKSSCNGDVFECNDSCACKKIGNCKNRVTQVSSSASLRHCRCLVRFR